MYSCALYASVCMSCVFKNCIEQFKTEIWDSQNGATFPWEEAMRASMNIHLERVGLVISDMGLGLTITCLHWSHFRDSSRLQLC